MTKKEAQNDHHIVTLRRSRRVSHWRGFFAFGSEWQKKEAQNDKKRRGRM